MCMNEPTHGVQPAISRASTSEDDVNLMTMYYSLGLFGTNVGILQACPYFLL